MSSASDYKATVLLVDDDADLLALMTRWLEHADLRIMAAESGREALARMEVRRPDLVLTDLVMDGMDGLDLLGEIHRVDPLMPVIILSGQAQIPDAIRAAHLGVAGFLTKPMGQEDLIREVRDVLESRGGSESPQTLSRFAPELIYRSPAMQHVLERARLVAKVDSTVLINGATGTGKEMLAKAIHQGSRRADGPFVSINCTALPEQLLESELFGHEKGAFTGAVNRYQGLFRAAEGGTLFLDEIGDMPDTLQAKLLRVLQDFQVRPVGSTRSVAVDVRIVSATHRDLMQAVAEGDFREDLYYRLSVVPLEIPALAERREDIPALIEHFLQRYAQRADLARRHFSPDAREQLLAAPWPGNVRQLENVVEQCTVLSGSETIPASLLALALREQPGEVLPLDEARLAFERQYLVSLLRATGGKVTVAARLAGRNRTDFYKLLKRHELDAGSFRDAPELSQGGDS